MAARGESFGVAPQACPFVALEDDRDARAESPDPRHRCYAEPTPEPRALAHQEAFCLSPTFAGCPIFQDWAARAAARPVSPVAATSAATEQLGVFDAVDEPAAAAEEQDSADEQVAAAGPLAVGIPPGVIVTGSMDDQSADDPGTTGDLNEAGPRGLGEADWSAAAGTAADLHEPVRTVPADLDEVLPEHEIPSPYARKADASDVAQDPPEDEIPPVPPFLAGRSGAESVVPASSAPPPLGAERPTVPANEVGRPGTTDPLGQQVEIPPPLPRSSLPRVIPSEKVEREDVVPSWEIDGRFGAQPEPEPSEDRFGGWLTAIAVVAILALGVAGVIFLPGLLSGSPARSPAPSATIRPSLVPTASSPLATASDSLPTVSASPDETAPTVAPTAEGTPRLYRIRAGDSLARIARRFDTTVDDILAANPDIANPNEIQVGQLIVIPQPLPTAAP